MDNRSSIFNRLPDRNSSSNVFGHTSYQYENTRDIFPWNSRPTSKSQIQSNKNQNYQRSYKDTGYDNLPGSSNFSYQQSVNVEPIYSSRNLPPRSSQNEPQESRWEFNHRNQNETKNHMEFGKINSIDKPKFKPTFGDGIKYVRENKCGLKFYKCYKCKTGEITEEFITAHIDGRKHRLKLSESSHSVNTKSQNQGKSKECYDNKIYIHEPKFDFLVNLIEEPLVALEYVVEILNPLEKKPIYICILCNKKCDVGSIKPHLVSQSHIMNYLDKHFSPISARLRGYRRFLQDAQYKRDVLTKITASIDSKFPRSTAFIYEGQDFNNNKADIVDTINNKKHISINDIPYAENILLNGLNLNDEEWLRINPPVSPIKSDYLPENIKRKRKIPSDVLDEYHTSVALAIKELEMKFKKYENDPFSYPQCNDEWKLFYTQKVAELLKCGKDPSKHNFSDEWNAHINKRIHEQYKEEIKWKSDKIRKQLGLMREEVEDGKRNCPRDTDSDEEREELFGDRKGRYYISDDGNESFDEDYNEFGPRIPKEKKIFDNFMETVDNNKSNQLMPKPQVETKHENSTESTTLIKTCRLLVSLETELGLLASKMLDLLSKSIAFEREYSKSADVLLFENENLNLIETVKEKIIGMQLAQLIASNRMKVVEKALVEIDKLIQQHEVMLNIKKTLREMGKNEASNEEIEMLKAMIKKN